MPIKTLPSGSEQEPISAVLRNSDLTEVGTADNPLRVEQVLNNIMFNEYAHLHTGVISTLTVATNPAGTDRDITVANGALFLVGDIIQISNGIAEPTFAEIRAIVGNVLTLDRYIDYGHSIGDAVEIITYEMAVLGTPASPIEFIVRPEGVEVCHIQRMTFSMVHATQGDMALFGNLTRLTDGLIIRVRQNGKYRTLTNWKDNDEIKDDMYDVTFDARSSGGGSHGTSGRWTFERYGVEQRLDAATGDQMEFYVQDDLTGLDHFSIKAQGHYEEYV